MSTLSKKLMRLKPTQNWAILFSDIKISCDLMYRSVFANIISVLVLNAVESWDYSLPCVNPDRAIWPLLCTTRAPRNGCSSTVVT